MEWGYRDYQSLPGPCMGSGRKQSPGEPHLAQMEADDIELVFRERRTKQAQRRKWRYYSRHSCCPSQIPLGSFYQLCVPTAGLCKPRPSRPSLVTFWASPFVSWSRPIHGARSPWVFSVSLYASPPSSTIINWSVRKYTRPFPLLEARFTPLSFPY